MYVIIIANSKNLGKQYYQIIYSSNIKGKLTFVGVSSGSNYFQVDNNDNRFSFWEVRKKNDKEGFGFLAEVGDSVLKNSNSDTIFLIKGKNRYEYLIDKIE